MNPRRSTPKKTSKKKTVKRPTQPLPREDVLRLIAACSRRAPTGIRNAALISFLYRTGARIAEARGLRPADLDLDAGTARILHGKGDKARAVGLDAEALAFLGRWNDRRAKLRPPKSAPFFCTLRGAPVSTAYVRALLPRLARKAGIERRAHAHGLRATFAAELLEAGNDLRVVRDALGHETLATTDRYLRTVHPKAVLDAMRNREAPPADPIAALQAELAKIAETLRTMQDAEKRRTETAQVERSQPRSTRERGEKSRSKKRR